jgi:hypothetical protein
MDDPNLHELPPIVIDGIPTPVEKMTQVMSIILHFFFVEIPIFLVLWYPTFKSRSAVVIHFFLYIFYHVTGTGTGTCSYRYLFLSESRVLDYNNDKRCRTYLCTQHTDLR